MSDEGKKADLRSTQEDVESARHQDELLRKYGRTAQLQGLSNELFNPHELGPITTSSMLEWARSTRTSKRRSNSASAEAFTRGVPSFPSFPIAPAHSAVTHPHGRTLECR